MLGHQMLSECYLFFCQKGIRLSDRCQNKIRYILMMQYQIFFLNLLNKLQMKSDDEPSDVFWNLLWQIKDSAQWPRAASYTIYLIFQVNSFFSFQTLDGRRSLSNWWAVKTFLFSSLTKTLSLYWLSKI